MNQLIKETILHQTSPFSPSDIYSEMIDNNNIPSEYFQQAHYHQSTDNILYHMIRKNLHHLKTKKMIQHTQRSQYSVI